MAIKTHSSPVLAAVLLTVTIGAAVVSLSHNIGVDLVFFGLIACVVSVYFAVRAPELFLVATIFVPQWKAYWPFSSVDRVVDLTGLMLACLGACIALRLLAHLGRLDRLGLNTLFIGQSSVIVAYLVFAVIVTLSYAYTTAPEYGASKLLRFLGIGSLLLISPMFLIRTEEDFRSFARIFVAFSGLTVIQLVGGLETVTSAKLDVTRIGAGWLVGMAAIIVMFYPLFDTPGIQRAFLICALPILVVGLIASVARGPMLALSVVLLIRLFLWFREGHRSTAVVLAAIFAFSGLGAFYALRNAGGSKYMHKINEIGRLAEGDMTKGSATMRVDFYRAALPAIPDHPLLGRGIGSWSVFYFGRDERGYPHNLLVEVAFEQGLLGLAAFFLFLWTLYGSTVWLQRNADSRYLVLGILILYCLMVAMFSGDLDDNRVLWLWAGMTMALCRTVKLQNVEKAFSAVRAPRVSRIFARPSFLHS